MCSLFGSLSTSVVVIGILLALILRNLNLSVSGVSGSGNTQVDFSLNASMAAEVLKQSLRIEALEKSEHEKQKQMEAMLGEDRLQLLETVFEKRSILVELLDVQAEKLKLVSKGMTDNLMESLLAAETWETIRERLSMLNWLNETTTLERDRVRAQIEVEAKMKFQSENFERIRAAEKQQLLAQEEVKGKNMINSINAAAYAFGQASCVLMCVFFSLLFVYKLLRDKPVPPLIEERVHQPIPWCGGRSRPALKDSLVSGTPKVILDDRTMKTVADFLHVLGLAKANDLPLPSACFYGLPGTGKTLTAKRIAETCGLDYAIITGGSVMSLQSAAVPELRKVFEWARGSRNGVILFVDEAEAFLQKRETCADPHTRAAISFFLSHTGETSKHFSLILATNRLTDLDPAVLSRMVHTLEFKTPSPENLQKLCEDRDPNLAKLVLQSGLQLLPRGNNHDVWSQMARARFSGRDMQQLHEEYKRQQHLQAARRLSNKSAETREWVSRFLDEKMKRRTESVHLY